MKPSVRRWPVGVVLLVLSIAGFVILRERSGMRDGVRSDGERRTLSHPSRSQPTNLLRTAARSDNALRDPVSMLRGTDAQDRWLLAQLERAGEHATREALELIRLRHAGASRAALDAARASIVPADLHIQLAMVRWLNATDGTVLTPVSLAQESTQAPRIRGPVLRSTRTR